MNKHDAIQLLGGTIPAASKAIGVSYAAVNKWPDVLPARIADRVQAALWRAHLAATKTAAAAQRKARRLTAKAVAAAAASAPPKRGRGRPRKVPMPIGETSSAAG